MGADAPDFGSVGASPRVSLSAPQTQALVSLLSTIGPYKTIDIREGAMGGDVFVTVWRQGYDTTWTLHLDGGTHESPAAAP